MTNDRRNAIEKLANSVREQLHISTPVNVKEIISTLGGSVRSERFDDSSISGKIQRKGSSFEISYNGAHSDERSTFTIAHELGHLFLHMGYLLDDEKWNNAEEYCDSPMYRQGYSEEEYEANQFAGSLLMPSDEYRTFVKEHRKEGRIDVNSIATHFGVSFDAALTRGKWIGIFEW